MLALESARAGALVVGEDLGTVEDELPRRRWPTRGVLSTRVVWFEDDPPEALARRRALAWSTTHDLPDRRRRVDRGRRRRAGRAAAAAARRGRRGARPARRGSSRSPPRSPGRGRRRRRAPAAVRGRVDARPRRPSRTSCGVPRPPNVPGTTTERPNWSHRPARRRSTTCPRDPARPAVAALAEPREAPRDGVTSPSGPPKMPRAGHGAEAARDRYLFRTNPPIGDAPGAKHDHTEATTDTRRRPERCRGDDGAGAPRVRAHLVLLFTLLFGIISFGLILSFQQDVTRAAAEGARGGAVAIPARARPRPGRARPRRPPTERRRQADRRPLQRAPAATPPA